MHFNQWEAISTEVIAYLNSWDDHDFINAQERLMIQMETERIFRSFISRLVPPYREPNPLPLLMRALNGLYLLHCTLRQPCWRATRFKSLT